MSYGAEPLVLHCIPLLPPGLDALQASNRMQMRMRDLATASAANDTPLTATYYRLFWLWFAFRFPAFGAVLAIFWLMIAKPQVW